MSRLTWDASPAGARLFNPRLVTESATLGKESFRPSIECVPTRFGAGISADWDLAFFSESPACLTRAIRAANSLCRRRSSWRVTSLLASRSVKELAEPFNTLPNAYGFFHPEFLIPLLLGFDLAVQH